MQGIVIAALFRLLTVCEGFFKETLSALSVVWFSTPESYMHTPPPVCECHPVKLMTSPHQHYGLLLA